MAEGDYSTVAMILAIIAGIFIIIGAALMLMASMAFSAADSAYAAYTGVSTGLGAMTMIMAVVGLVSGIIVIIGGVLMRNPNRIKMASVLVLVFSIVSLFGAGGGLVIGLILGIIAGILGLVSKPGATAAAPAQPTV